MDVQERIGENLARCRRRAGMGQEELALRIGVHRTEISIIERGGRCPRIEMLLKLAGTVGASPVELLEGIEWKPGPHPLRPGRFKVAALRRQGRVV